MDTTESNRKVTLSAQVFGWSCRGPPKTAQRSHSRGGGNPQRRSDTTPATVRRWVASTPWKQVTKKPAQPERRRLVGALEELLPQRHQQTRAPRQPARHRAFDFVLRRRTSA